jgi:DHA1 family tetracycline resistance protein-like MFS transporter
MQSAPVRKEAIVFLVASVFLSFVGFSIIVPTLPFLVAGLQVHGKMVAVVTSLLLTVYALLAFFSAPFLGALSDRYGRKPILIFSLLGSVAGYALLGIGGSIAALFLGRAIDGLTAGNTSTVFAAIADITDEKSRPRLFGLVGGIGGLGFIVGPALGGVLTHISIGAPFLFAGAVALLNALLGTIFFKESLGIDVRATHLAGTKLNPFGGMVSVLRSSLFKAMLSGALFFFLALNLMQSNATVYCMTQYGWTSAYIGIVLAIGGLANGIAQGFLARLLARWVGEKLTSIIGISILTIAFAIVSLTASIRSPGLLFFSLMLLVFGDGLFEPANMTLIANNTPTGSHGTVQGTYQAFQSLARIIGPLLAAPLYVVAPVGPYIAGALFGCIAMVFLLFGVKRKGG